jgi:hypothetical protein
LPGPALVTKNVIAFGPAVGDCKPAQPALMAAAAATNDVYRTRFVMMFSVEKWQSVSPAT